MIKSAYLQTHQDDSLVSAKELGVDAVFVSAEGLNSEYLANAKSYLDSEIKIYAVINVFKSSDLLEKFPDAKPLEAFGKDTLDYLCPTHEGVRNYALDQIRSMLDLDIHGVWLNHIQFPTKWDEKIPEIMDTCYCERCMSLFEDFIGEKVEGTTLEEKVLTIDGCYYMEWLQFKNEKITSFVQQAKNLITESGKNVHFGLFAIPWEHNEYSAAINRIISQDFETVKSLVDTFSPMLPHELLEKDIHWLKQKLDFFWTFGKPLMPLIQLFGRNREINEEEKNSILDLFSSKNLEGYIIQL